ncbi:energy coupling factor transporter S component ThiW [Peptostreptococcus equinus]|uniref:Energy coupling factor transporter S component ThiW n=1 Tax=Peptostreptococcus equinus TaxID=3003601 RepID=A0ABY7JPS8_9FIRM|nr:energy coupling factor transporter S component ThiW [Peptostreptococcus sp. CBA3647]WAW15110.1 energy coupling factor transporter S component ThiW [Peptostreptococcus sp. CBA3647]
MNKLIEIENEKNNNKVNNYTNHKKMIIGGLLIGISVIGSFISFPIMGSKCAPVQHIVNVLAAVILGPAYAVAMAFISSFLRNIMGLGSILAFPGSMIGALLAGIVYKKTKNILTTCVGEAFGTGIIGGLCAYPIALLFMGKVASQLAFYVYIVPFLVSTVVGSIIGGVIAISLKKTDII